MARHDTPEIDRLCPRPARRLLQRAGGGFGLIGLAGLLQHEGLLATAAEADDLRAWR